MARDNRKEWANRIARFAGIQEQDDPAQYRAALEALADPPADLPEDLRAQAATLWATLRERQTALRQAAIKDARRILRDAALPLPERAERIQSLLDPALFLTPEDEAAVADLVDLLPQLVDSNSWTRYKLSLYFEHVQYVLENADGPDADDQAEHVDALRLLAYRDRMLRRMRDMLARLSLTLEIALPDCPASELPLLEQQRAQYEERVRRELLAITFQLEDRANSVSVQDYLTWVEMHEEAIQAGDDVEANLHALRQRQHDYADYCLRVARQKFADATGQAPEEWNGQFDPHRSLEEIEDALRIGDLNLHPGKQAEPGYRHLRLEGNRSRPPVANWLQDKLLREQFALTVEAIGRALAVVAGYRMRWGAGPSLGLAYEIYAAYPAEAFRAYIQREETGEQIALRTAFSALIGGNAPDADLAALPLTDLAVLDHEMPVSRFLERLAESPLSKHRDSILSPEARQLLALLDEQVPILQARVEALQDVRQDMFEALRALENALDENHSPAELMALRNRLDRPDIIATLPQALHPQVNSLLQRSAARLNLTPDAQPAVDVEPSAPAPVHEGAVDLSAEFVAQLDAQAAEIMVLRDLVAKQNVAQEQVETRLDRMMEQTHQVQQQAAEQDKLLDHYDAVNQQVAQQLAGLQDASLNVMNRAKNAEARAERAIQAAIEQVSRPDGLGLPGILSLVALAGLLLVLVVSMGQLSRQSAEINALQTVVAEGASADSAATAFAAVTANAADLTPDTGGGEGAQVALAGTEPPTLLPPTDSSEADFDGDGVPDDRDTCGDQGDEGYGIDEYGCPLAAPTQTPLPTDPPTATPVPTSTLWPTETEVPTNTDVSSPADFDGDGVPDDRDTCGDQGDEGYGVDEQGCPLAAPTETSVPPTVTPIPTNTPAPSATPQPTETPLPTPTTDPAMLDTDGDGVNDGSDACPEQGASEYGLYANGCPPAGPDTDLDGVLDKVDACPEQGTSEYGLVNGCPLRGELRDVLDGIDADDVQVEEYAVPDAFNSIATRLIAGIRIAAEYANSRELNATTPQGYWTASGPTRTILSRRYVDGRGWYQMLFGSSLGWVPADVLVDTPLRNALPVLGMVTLTDENAVPELVSDYELLTGSTAPDQLFVSILGRRQVEREFWLLVRFPARGAGTTQAEAILGANKYWVRASHVTTPEGASIVEQLITVAYYPDATSTEVVSYETTLLSTIPFIAQTVESYTLLTGNDEDIMPEFGAGIRAVRVLEKLDEATVYVELFDEYGRRDGAMALADLIGLPEDFRLDTGEPAGETAPIDLSG